MQEIYAHTDYRAFLKGWFEARSGRPSIRGFAKKVGCSPAQLSSVLAGSRDLAAPLAETVAGALGLDDDGRDFFLELVRFEQAETRVQRREALDRIMATRRFHESKRIEDTMYLLFSRWYYPALIELARCRGFRADPDWLAATLVPPVPRAEIVEALDALRRDGFLVPDGHGGLTPGHPNYATTHEVSRVAGPALVNLHRWLLARAPEALEEFPQNERHFGTVSMALSEAGMLELKRMVTRFEQDVIGRVTDQVDPTRVYQLCVQLFPITKPTGS